MSVADDGTVAYVYERLEISLRSLSDAELNRSFPSHSNQGAESTNPYTYGDWTPLGDDWRPARFTVFLLKAKNYAYPKIKIDPLKVTIRSASGREYQPLDLLRLTEYFRSHALAWAGNAHQRYRQQADVLRRTMYKNEILFSGLENEGYLIFPPLPPDVTDLTVTLEDIALRFNYADEPVETIQLTYKFERDVYKGYEPPAELAGQN